MAAKTDGIGVDELALGEDRDRRRAAAHVDGGAAEFDLIIDQGSQAAGIGVATMPSTERWRG